MNANRIPSLNWLRAFEAAARTGSFAGAARLLNVSATAASKQIRALEEYLGSPLFIRHAHSVEITKAGRDFLLTVQQSLFAIKATASAMFGEHAGGAVAAAYRRLLVAGGATTTLSRGQPRGARPVVHVGNISAAGTGIGLKHALKDTLKDKTTLVIDHSKKHG